MRHRKLSSKLSRTTAHRKALLMNLVRSLLEHERICTTLPKARVASSYADRMITLAKKKDLSSERKAVDFLTDRAVVKKLFKEIGPRFQDRKGGYTRVIRLGRRAGDKAFMAILELVSRTQEEVTGEAPVKEAKADKKKEKAEAKA
jgi:large subunit ribosomal protein L17